MPSPPRQNKRGRFDSSSPDTSSTLNGTNSTGKSLSENSAIPVHIARQLDNRYNQLSSAPYLIQIIDCSSDRHLGNLHPMTLGKVFSKFNQELIEIKPSGRDRISLFLDNPVTANLLIESEIQKINPNWVTFIPDHRISIAGLIRGVDTDLTVQDILEGLRVFPSDITVSHVERLSRNSDIAESEASPKNYQKRVPTSSVKIYFLGTKLPDYVSIWYVKRKVAPFIPSARICFNCFLFGHIKEQCRFKGERCTKCSGLHSLSNCTEDKFFCRNCLQEHAPLHKQCPAFLTYKKINDFRFINKISFKEAKRQIRESEMVRNHIENADYLQDFPPLSRNKPESSYQINHNIPSRPKILSVSRKISLPTTSMGSLISTIPKSPLPDSYCSGRPIVHRFSAPLDSPRQQAFTPHIYHLARSFNFPSGSKKISSPCIDLPPQEEDIFEDAPSEKSTEDSVLTVINIQEIVRSELVRLMGSYLETR